MLTGMDAGLPEPAAHDALVNLLRIARSDTGQSRVVADFLLAWWNAESCGGFDLADLWAVDRALAEDMLEVVGFIVRHRAYPSSFGLSAEFGEVLALWRPQLLTSATP